MKIVLSSLFFLWCLSSLNAEGNKEWIECEKTYINQSQVRFLGRSIFVHFGENQWARTGAVFADNDGLYINFYQIVDEKSLSWTCDNCGKHNEAYRDTCRKCGEPKPYDDYYD